MVTLLVGTQLYNIYFNKGVTKFSGCQCYKDCSCAENYKPVPYEYYSVKKRFGKIKTTYHSTMAEAESRVKELLDLKRDDSLVRVYFSNACYRKFCHTFNFKSVDRCTALDKEYYSCCQLGSCDNKEMLTALLSQADYKKYFNLIERL